MAKKEDQFDKFLSKQFGNLSQEVKIEKGAERGRMSSFEDRRRQVEATGGTAAVVQENESVAPQAPVKKGGRPPRPKDVEVVKMSIILESDLKHRLDELKVRDYRSSVTELIKEAVRDLLVKYGME